MLRSGRKTRVGDQLELSLVVNGVGWQEPWGGISPRLLVQGTKMSEVGKPELIPAGAMGGNDFAGAVLDQSCSGESPEQLLLALSPGGRDAESQE